MRGIKMIPIYLRIILFLRKSGNYNILLNNKSTYLSDKSVPYSYPASGIDLKSPLCKTMIWLISTLNYNRNKLLQLHILRF